MDVVFGKTAKRFDLNRAFAEKYFIGLNPTVKHRIRADPEVWKYLVWFSDATDLGKTKPKTPPLVSLFWPCLTEAHRVQCHVAVNELIFYWKQNSLQLTTQKSINL